VTRRSLRHPHQPYRQIVKHWPAPGRLLSVGTHRLHLHCMGQGTPAMVLESGMSGWSQDWAWVQAHLAQGGQVCSYDRAGYGWSDPAPAPRDGLAAVDDLRRTLDTAGVATPRLLVGHSMGGLLIGLYARAYPREVAGLAFLDAVGRDYASQFPPERYRAFRSNLGRMLTVADVLAPLGLPQWFGQPASIIAARLPAEQRDAAVALSFSARHYHALRMENAGFDAVLEEALALGPLPAVPTVVLSSEQMRDFPPGLEDEVMRQAWRRNQHSIAQEAGVQATALAGSGHYLHIDQPDAVAHALDAWREQARHRAASR
jgi:pimeloyl-ACP methyl ester carboxylesterase